MAPFCPFLLRLPGVKQAVLGVVGVGSPPSRAAAGREYIARVLAALQEMEPRVQLLVRARLEDTASFTELARQLGYGSETAARRAFYAAQARLTLILHER